MLVEIRSRAYPPPQHSSTTENGKTRRYEQERAGLPSKRARPCLALFAYAL
jgi:hypothetical protein